MIRIILLSLLLTSCNVYKSMKAFVPVVVFDVDRLGKDSCKYYMITTKKNEDMVTDITGKCGMLEEGDTVYVYQPGLLKWNAQ